MESNKNLQTLSICLIKEKFTSVSHIINDANCKPPISLNIAGASDVMLYLKQGEPHPPKWSSLFEQLLDKNALGYSASVSAVLILKINERYYVLLFGPAGRFLLKDDVCEDRFGLLVALNSVNRDTIRCIDKKSLDSIESQTRVQSSAGASADMFGLNVEQDMLKAIIGTPNEINLGSSMAGTDSLSVSVRMELNDLVDLLLLYKKKYDQDLDDSYYDWVNNINVVKSNSSIIQFLEALLVEKFKNKDYDGLWLSIPEIIPWNPVVGFSYTHGKKSIYPDINLYGFLASIKDKEITLKLLHDVKVSCMDDSHNPVHKSWSAYKCIYAEIDYKNQKYILNDGSWFKVDSDFVEKTNKLFSILPKSNLNLPVYSGGGEGKYNSEVANLQPSNFFLLDDENKIFHGGGKGQIEVCDLLGIDKNLIHVKMYGKSSVLSHLFSQGFVSGQLIQVDSEFRKKIIDKVSPAFKGLLSEQNKPKENEFTITYAIISESIGELYLPFFSRVNLLNTAKILRGFGYKVEMLKIEVDPQFAKTARVKSPKPPKTAKSRKKS